MWQSEDLLFAPVHGSACAVDAREQRARWRSSAQKRRLAGPRALDCPGVRNSKARASGGTPHCQARRPGRHSSSLFHPPTSPLRQLLPKRCAGGAVRPTRCAPPCTNKLERPTLTNFSEQPADSSPAPHLALALALSLVSSLLSYLCAPCRLAGSILHQRAYSAELLVPDACSGR